MDLRKIKKLIEMLQESDLNEIEVKEGEESVRINRKKESSVQPNLSSFNLPVQKTTAQQVQEEEIVSNEHLNHVTSPMVGTFYRKPSPDKEPFVEVGQNIRKGDTVCIIEAMKMMNQVKSEFDGKIVAINVGDGEPVEFGQELISIEKS
tara:strand:+ start:1521 stop:1967 length:447 start_codon:yes stop_codon:yes gene_type:complete